MVILKVSPAYKVGLQKRAKILIIRTLQSKNVPLEGSCKLSLRTL